MNHPLVRRKFHATFFSLESGYGDRVVENVGRVSQSGGTRYCSFLLSRLAFKHSSIPSFSPSPFITNPIFLFSNIQCYFPSSSYFAYTFSAFSISAYRVFLRIVFFFYPFVSSATHFSFALLPSSRTLVPSRSEIGLGAGVNIGSIYDLPRATITCNTVGLSGPMGTRWGVLSVRKKDITVTHIESGAAPLRRARSVALVLSWLTCLTICQGPLFN